MPTNTTISPRSSAPLGASWSAPVGALGAVVRLGGSLVGAGAMTIARDHRAPRRYAKRVEQGFEQQNDRQPEDRLGRDDVGAEVGRRDCAP